jgi:hypothetical protein
VADRKQVNLKLTEEELAFLDEIGPNRAAAMRTILVSAMAEQDAQNADEPLEPVALTPSRVYVVEQTDCLHKFRDMRGRCLACGHTRSAAPLEPAPYRPQVDRFGA